MFWSKTIHNLIDILRYYDVLVYIVYRNKQHPCCVNGPRVGGNKCTILASPSALFSQIMASPWGRKWGKPLLHNWSTCHVMLNTSRDIQPAVYWSTNHVTSTPRAERKFNLTRDTSCDTDVTIQYTCNVLATVHHGLFCRAKHFSRPNQG